MQTTGITLADQITEVQKQLVCLNANLPKMVTAGQITAQKANRRRVVMQAVLETLLAVSDGDLVTAARPVSFQKGR